MPDLQREATEVLQTLVRFNTVNPPGHERAAIEYLDAYLQAAGFETEQLAVDPERPNLVATLAGEVDGPVMVYLGHVDTVLAAQEEWDHDPWGGEVADGELWGRGALDMKSQVAAEAVGAAVLARAGWRPARGALKLVFVADEETGGDLGARWLTEQHPDKVRCDLLLNEGAGSTFQFGGLRRYGVCCGEKGIFRFRLTAHGVAGHASLPRTGDNALLKLVPVLERLAGGQPDYDLTVAPRALLEELGFDSADPAAAVSTIGAADPALRILLEPLLGVTLTPTVIHASDKINVIPSRAYLKVDCRVPPGFGDELALQRLQEVLGDAADGLEIEFTEKVYGYASPIRSPLMDAISRWVGANDPEAAIVPVLLAGYSDSSWFRRAFPDLVAYGFFPHRHQTLLEAAPLVHSANERIDVRDLGFAAHFYADIARELLG
jgi:acetylornithine deacetylase/succinyl-diaminopimelate desuccinylase-like protein